jgi:hypothetical protein
MKPTIAILSIGEMGLGVARLLKFHGYRIVTNVSDRRLVDHTININLSLSKNCTNSINHRTVMRPKSVQKYMI